MRQKYNTAFYNFVYAVKTYLINNLGWCEDEARRYCADHEQFKPAWIDGKTASECVNNDLDLFREHESDDGDGIYSL